MGSLLTHMLTVFVFGCLSWTNTGLSIALVFCYFPSILGISFSLSLGRTWICISWYSWRRHKFWGSLLTHLSTVFVFGYLSWTNRGGNYIHYLISDRFSLLLLTFNLHQRTSPLIAIGNISIILLMPFMRATFFLRK